MKTGTPGFVGLRLREAREIRGMAATALADQLGVSRQAVSQYETGQQSPAPAVMRRITEILRTPWHRFLRPLQQPSSSNAIFYRSMATALKGARTRAQRRYDWLREIVAYQRRFVRFPELKVPDFNTTEDPALLADAEIEDFAEATRRFWGLGDGPISNVLWLIENNGVIVARHDLFARTLDAFSQWAEDNAPYIALGTGKESAVRSRFDVAHELGHIVMHRKVPRSLLGQQARFNFIERQANRFAAAFLLPRSSFLDELESIDLDAMLALKPRWGVSVALMVMRAKHLGLLSNKDHKRFIINMGRRNWRTKEPLDDVLAIEEPRLLRRSFDLLVKSGLVARHEIPVELAMSGTDIEELIGLPAGYFDAAPPPAELLNSPEPQEKQTSEKDESGIIIKFPGAEQP